MTVINFNKHVYPYGTFYDASKVDIPKKEQNWTGIIIYVSPEIETARKICSLEGFFASELPILSKEDTTSITGNPLVQRIQMRDFEEKYKGKFIPCGE